MSSFEYRSHAAHNGKNKAATLEDYPGLQPPSEVLHSESEDVNAMLERLDDVIFDAVRGNGPALEKAKTMWPQVVLSLGWELVEESREQYLRFALDIIRNAEQESSRNPDQSIAALEVVSLLTKN